MAAAEEFARNCQEEEAAAMRMEDHRAASATSTMTPKNSKRAQALHFLRTVANDRLCCCCAHAFYAPFLDLQPGKQFIICFRLPDLGVTEAAWSTGLSYYASATLISLN